MKAVKENNVYKAVSAIGRYYWKNRYAPNATKYGTLTENNGVASGFSTSNYYNTTLININNNNFDLVAKVYGYSTSHDNPVYANEYLRLYLPKIVVRKQGTIQVSLSNSTSGWNVCDFGSVESIPSDAWVWIKVSYDGTAYTINTSLDGQLYTEIGRYATTTTYSQDLNTIGACYDTSSSGLKTGYGGQIDLTGCYLNINGERVWDGVNVTSRVPANTFVQPILTENGIIGGNTFACAALNTDTRTAPYMAFDSNKANAFTAGWLSKATNNYFEWYNPKALNISKLEIQYMTSNSSAVGYLTSWTIQASNDGETFIDILSGTDGNFGLTTINIQHSGYYKYWRLLPLTWSDEWYCIVNMDIIATTEGEDYDYYSDEITYKGVNL